jgi:thiamine transporter ThiT
MTQSSAAGAPAFGSRSLLFVMAALSGALLVVLLAFRDLPMVDLPQHAAQIASWLRLDDPASGFAERFELNLRTPYVLANALARALAPAVEVIPALKLVAWLSIVGNMLGLWALARRLGHDPWIALLGLITACGSCFYWGFISFMLAVALGFFALALALDHARAPSPKRGALLALALSLTLLAHGVAFALCAGLVGVVLLRGTSSLLARLAPFGAPGAVAMLWFLPGPIGQRIGGDSWELSFRRAIEFPALLTSFGASDHFGVALGIGVIAAAFALLGARRASEFERPLLLAGLVAAYALFPVMFRGIALLHTRLPALLFPVLLLALRAAPARSPAFVNAARGAVLLLSMICFGVFSSRLVAFKREAASYHDFLRGLPAGLAMRPIIFERNTQVFPGVPAYLHYSAYYYVEKGGFQGYSFAMYPISVVRYRPGVKAGMLNAAEWRPELFDRRVEIPEYDFFLVRSQTDQSAVLFENSPLPVVLTKRIGPWWGYEKASAKLGRAGASAGEARVGR